jgi:hypothetical protein
MLDIGKTNLFLNDKATYVVSKLIDDYDLIGHNCLYHSAVLGKVSVKFLFLR